MTTDVKAPRDFSTEKREGYADKGVAMPDGSYPIPDKDALRRAIASYGRAKDPAAVKAHIIKRAKALGATSMLPEDWGGAPAKASVAAMHAEQGADILSDLYCLIGCESDEPDQLAMLQRAVDAVSQWLDAERGEIGGAGDEMAEMDMAYPKAKASDLKAEEMTTSQLERWLKGEIPRRILVLPYGGLIPSDDSPLGVDLDHEWFDEQTDHVGNYAALKATRERAVDWHHTTGAGEKSGYSDPVGGTMKGAILGRIVLDDGPDTVRLDREYTGIWADWWTKFGDQGRRALIAELERMGTPLYGSTQPVTSGVRKASNGHIDRWPIYWHTITTNPRNHLAVVPPLKAAMSADLPFDQVGLGALRAALVGLEDLSTDLHATSRGGERAAKARRLSTVISEGEQVLHRLRTRIEQSHGVVS